MCDDTWVYSQQREGTRGPALRGPHGELEAEAASETSFPLSLLSHPRGQGALPTPRHPTFQALPRACEFSRVPPSTCHQPGIQAAGSAGPWPSAAQPGHLNNQIPPIPASHAGLIATCFSSSAPLLGDSVSSSLYLKCPLPPPPPHPAELQTSTSSGKSSCLTLPPHVCLVLSLNPPDHCLPRARGTCGIMGRLLMLSVLS